MGLMITPQTFFQLFVDAAPHCKEPIAAALEQQFSLIAIVLHDSNAHSRLDDVLQERFAVLDKETGPRLLFMTLFDQLLSERSEYNPHHPNTREWERTLYSQLQNTDLCPMFTADERYDQQTVCIALAALLDIPLSSFPCLVITSVSGLLHFNERRDPIPGAWMEITDRDIESTLLRLGQMASSVPARFNMWGFERLMENLCGSNQYPNSNNKTWGIIQDSWKVTESLARVLNASNSSPLSQIERTSDWLTRTMNTEKQSRDRHTGELYYTDSSIAHKNTLLQGLLLLLEHSNQSSEHKDDVTENRFEYAVQASFNTGLKLLDTPNLQDYSGAMLGMSKALEILLNSSIVQFIRCDFCGIPMPTYYRRYAPKHSRDHSDIPSGGTYIQLNKNRKGTWWPLTLGQIPHLIKAYDPKSDRLKLRNIRNIERLHLEYPHGTASLLSSYYKTNTIFLRHLQRVVSLRNRAAHYEIVQREAALEVYQSWKELQNSAILDELYKCWSALKPKE